MRWYRGRRKSVQTMELTARAFTQGYSPQCFLYGKPFAGDMNEVKAYLGTFRSLCETEDIPNL